jgi:glutathione S-transferase
MTALPLTSLATLIAIALYFYMGLQVGMARGKYNIPAPATSGDPIFERYFRVHMNTLEGMIMFLPCLWMFANFHSDIIAAALALVWVIGRFLFMQGYIKDPKSRGVGFMTQFAALVILFGGCLVGVVQSFLG